MNRIGIIAVIVILVVGVLGYFLLNNGGKIEKSEKTSSNNSTINENANDNNERENNESKDDIINTSNGKTLVVYYSASGSTKKVAEQIAENLSADLFEITPIDKYTSDDLNWSNEDSRVSREHNDESLRNVKLTTTKVNNWDDYNTILIGYPIWWGIAAWPVDTFVKNNDFTNKTVILFCTSASSGLGKSKELLEAEANGGNWLTGYRFSSLTSSSDIKTWTDSLK